MLLFIKGVLRGSLSNGGQHAPVRWRGREERSVGQQLAAEQASQGLDGQHRQSNGEEQQDYSSNEHQHGIVLNMCIFERCIAQGCDGKADRHQDGLSRDGLGGEWLS
ncbi:hypothetical protein D9M71_200910 [compost metagenome]